MAESYGDLVAAALRPDAEAARAEIRAEGIECPSCGVNMADLPEDHALALSREEPWTAKCAAGALAELAEFAQWQAAANIQVWDTANRGFDEYARKNIIGEGPANFTGILDALGG